MPGNDLLALAQEAARRVQDSGHPQAGSIGADLTWAAFNLQASMVGARMLELLGSNRSQEVMALFESTWDALETAGMSLGFGDAVTALDLCADALYLAAGGVPAPNGQFKDMGHWKSPPSRAVLGSATRQWIEDLLSHSKWIDLFRLWRSAITHRRLRRDIAISSVEPGGGGSRALSRIGLPGGSVGSGVDMLTKVTELLEFAREEFRTFCGALIADYGK